MPDRISSSHGRVSYEEWRLTHPPMAGGAPEGDTGDGGGDGDTGGTDTPATPVAVDTGKQGGDDESVTLSKREFEQLQKRQRDAESNARKLKREQEEASKRAQEEAGEFERLYTQEKEAHAATRQQVAQKAKENSIIAIAQRLHFRNPALVVAMIDRDVPTADVVDEDFEVTERPIERALTRLAEREEYLVDRPQGQAGEAGSGERRNGSTREREVVEEDGGSLFVTQGGRRLDPKSRLKAYHAQNPPRSRSAR